MTAETAVVTGANRADGIGIALVRELRARGVPTVVGTYRERSRSDALFELSGADEGVFATQLDVTSTRSVTAFGNWCANRFERLDLLVNNAGTGATREPIDRAPIAELEHALQVHGVGMLRVTRAALPLMSDGSVVVSISSGLGSISRMGAGSTFYAPAKALQNALTRQLAAAIRDRGIVAFSVSPGWVATSMGGPNAPLDAEESARKLAEMMLAADADDAGTFRDLDGKDIAW